MGKINYYKYTDTGLLIIRVGLGVMFMLHGYPKIAGGIEKWVKLGENMEHVGIGFGAAFWGFMAAFAEFGGGLLLVAGLFTRVAGLMMAFTMLIAMMAHLSKGEGLMDASHAVEAGIVFLALYFTGPGKYSLDRALAKNIK